jgi:hypothetical protein
MRLSYAMADLDGLIPQVASLSFLRIVLQNLNQNGLVFPPSPFALVTLLTFPCAYSLLCICIYLPYLCCGTICYVLTATRLLAVFWAIYEV